MGKQVKDFFEPDQIAEQGLFWSVAALGLWQRLFDVEF